MNDIWDSIVSLEALPEKRIGLTGLIYGDMESVPMITARHITERHHVVMEEEKSDKPWLQWMFCCTRCDGTDFILNHPNGDRVQLVKGDYIYLSSDVEFMDLISYFEKLGFTVEVK